MTSAPTSAQLKAIKAHLAEFEPRIRDAFLDAIYSARAGVDFPAFLAALERGDVAGAVTALDVSEAQLWRLSEEVRAAYLWMGDAQISAIAPAGLGGASWRFDGSNPVAQAWVAQRGADLVQGIVADAKEATRAAIVDSLERAQERGLREAALDIVGRISRTTGQREGGILGLTYEQTQYVINARDDLNTLNARYFTRAKRDKRFDGIVRRAIADGKPLSQADVDRIVGRYKDRLLSYRGDVIAQHEAFAAQAAAREEAMRQVSLRNDVEAVTRRWQLGFPKEHRINHVALSGQTISIDDRFDLGNGLQAAYPHDASLPPGETINCRCSVVYRTRLRRD